MFGPLEIIIFIGILGGLIAGLLVLVLRGIPLLIKYLINPKIKKDSTIKKKTRSSKILNKINFRSYGLKEWAFISIIFFVSFFFLEKFYNSIARDHIDNGYEIIQDFFQNIPKEYKNFKEDNAFNKTISSSSKKLGISKDEVKNFKRKEEILRVDFKYEYDKLLSIISGKRLDSNSLKLLNSSKLPAILSCDTISSQLNIYKFMDSVDQKEQLKINEIRKELKEELKNCIQENEKKEIEKKRKLKLQKIKLNCYQKRITSIPNIFTYSNLEKYKKDLENISKC